MAPAKGESGSGYKGESGHKGESGYIRRRTLRERLGDALDLPPGLTLNLAEINLTGDREVVISNHRGVAHYSPERISVEISGGLVEIYGKELVLRYILRNEIRAEGRIEGLKFITQGKTN
ncbi:MAG TPA: sporulation protein YqfC [Clostridia bacterium]|nr:sporulation protein YqfC [Clostridia bacterium]